MTKAKHSNRIRNYKKIESVKLNNSISRRLMKKHERKAYTTQVEVYRNLKSFEEFCCYGYLFAKDKVAFSPCSYPSDGPNLYEGNNDTHYYVQEFNKYRFYTETYQPAQPNKQCEFINSNGQYEYVGEHYQKAYIDGWMLNSTALKVYNALKNDSRITVKTSKTDDLKFFEEHWNNLKVFENLDTSNITYIRISDNKCNNDQYLFKKLLSVLSEINKPVRLSRYPNLSLLDKSNKWEIKM